MAEAKKTAPTKATADKNNLDAAKADEQPVDEAAVEPQLTDSTKATRQGNTNPADFDVFDDKGVFIEKRDR